MNKNLSDLKIRIFPIKQEDEIRKQERLNELQLKQQLLSYGIILEFDKIRHHGLTLDSNNNK